MAEHQTLVDNRLSVETPEGVEYDLELVGIAPRMGAYAIDMAIRVLVLAIFGAVFAIVASAAFTGLFLIFYFLVMWCYYPLFEVYWEGQTPGKRALGIAVVNRDGTQVGWYGAVIRNLIRVADLLPFGYAVGLISMVVSGRFQRLGDLAGDTVVVFRREAFTPHVRRRLQPAEPFQLSLVLGPREQEAIVDFSERAGELGPSRSAELAGILSPITAASSPEESAEKLYGVATRIVRWG